MLINYILRTLKLIILIFNISFFFGILWLIFCDLTEGFTIKNFLEMDLYDMDDTFLDLFYLRHKSNID